MNELQGEVLLSIERREQISRYELKKHAGNLEEVRKPIFVVQVKLVLIPVRNLLRVGTCHGEFLSSIPPTASIDSDQR